jgi:hypothetical protein
MSLPKKLFVLAAGAALFAGVSASAATLGGVETPTVGANSNVVAAPFTGGAKVAFTTAYNATSGAYLVTGLTVTAVTGSIPATATVKVTLKSATASLGEFSSTDGGATWTAPGSAITASDVANVSLVINGGVTSVDSTID